MNAKILRPRKWPPTIRIFFVFFIILISIIIQKHILDYFVIRLTSMGIANSIAFFLILVWICFDGVFGRKAVQIFCSGSEPALSQSILFWRKMILILCVQIGIAAAAIAIVSNPETDGFSGISGSNLSAFFILLSSFAASWGLLYQAHLSNLSTRMAETRKAIREYIDSSSTLEAHRQMVAMSEYIRKNQAIPENLPLPIESMGLRLNEMPEELRPAGDQSVSLSQATSRFFNAFNRLAWEAREGYLNAESLADILQQRISRNLFIYSSYIAQETKAKQMCGRLIAQEKTWENLLWLGTIIQLENNEQHYRQFIVSPPGR